MVRAPLHFHGRIPVPEVAPLTYRDGVSQLELVYELSQYLKKILHPSLQSTVNKVVADAERLLSEANAQYVDGVQEFQRIHDAFMSDVNAHLVALNDGAVSDLVEDDTSKLGGTLREIFATHTAFEDYTEGLNNKLTNHREHVEEQYTQLSRDVSNTINTYGERLVTVENVWPEYYGARGDNTGDDVEALQAWLDAGNTNLKPGSVYRVSHGIHAERDHVTIHGNGAEIHITDDTGQNMNTFAFTITGDYTTVANTVIHADKGHARGGIRIIGDYATIENNTVRNLTGELSVYAIQITSIVGGNTVTGNTVRQLRSTGSGPLGVEVGIVRGVYYRTVEGGAIRQTVIAENVIDGLYGQEGDGIQLLFRAVNDGPRGSAHTVIRGNTVDNCSRRCLKIQASHVTVHDNTLKDTTNELKHHPQPCLDIIGGNNIQVFNNEVNYHQHTSGISYSGVTIRNNYLVVKNNVVRGPLGQRRTNIYATDVMYSTIDGNTIIGGYRGIAIGNANVCSVSRNTVHSISSSDTISGAMGINVTPSSENVYLVGNIDMTWNSGHLAFNNRSSGGRDSGNVSVGR